MSSARPQLPPLVSLPITKKPRIADEALLGRDLGEHGVAVMPITDETARERWETQFWTAMDEFPEFIVKGQNVQRVLGGFGALGNPASFHHPTMRKFRHELKSMVHPVMCAYAQQRFPGEEAKSETVHLEAMFDRLCVRAEEFHRPTAEAWHRDIYDGSKYGLRELPQTLPNGEADLLFGGWSNLDHRKQRFVGLVGTQDDTVDAAGGFSTFSKERIKEFGFNERLAQQAGKTYGTSIQCDENGEILVPPGHAILFRQRLVHSVKSGPQPNTPALRVFHGFRLTCEKVPLFDLKCVVANNAVPRIPSGQIPPMYSQNHYAAFSNASETRWRTWGALTFRPECLYRRTTPAGTHYCTPGSRDNLNPDANRGRYMPSLAEMGLPVYTYTAEDVEVLSPQPLTC